MALRNRMHPLIQGFAFLTLVSTTGARAATSPLLVTSVDVDAAAGKVYVYGENFGTVEPSVRFAGLPAAVLEHYNTTLTVAIPFGLLKTPGTYLLSVSEGATPEQNSAIGVTIGGQGPKGDTGPAGPKGDTGATGAKGPTGDTGPVGAQGDKGDTGDTGPQGVAGPQGPKGDVGPQGVAGVPGPKGDTGPQGLPGMGGEPCTGRTYKTADNRYTLTISGTISSGSVFPLTYRYGAGTGAASATGITQCWNNRLSFMPLAPTLSTPSLLFQ